MSSNYDFVFANRASALLGADILAGDTELELVAGSGDLFPDPIYGEQFAITVKHPTTSEVEIMYCTRRFYGDTLEVVRAREGTIAIAFPAGATVAHQVTAGVLEYLRDL